MMKTFVLFWNPAISSYKLENFQSELEEFGHADMTEYKLYSEKEITIYLNLTIEGKINAYHGGFDLEIKKS